MLSLDPATGPAEFARARPEYMPWSSAIEPIIMGSALGMLLYLLGDVLHVFWPLRLMGFPMGVAVVLIIPSLVALPARWRHHHPRRADLLPAWSVVHPVFSSRARRFLAHRLSPVQQEAALVLGGEFTGTLADLVTLCQDLCPQ